MDDRSRSLILPVAELLALGAPVSLELLSQLLKAGVIWGIP